MKQEVSHAPSLPKLKCKNRNVTNQQIRVDIFNVDANQQIAKFDLRNSIFKRNQNVNIPRLEFDILVFL